jgi:ABC-type dipeptide/oligopeptide/nickel transport system permease subunit
MIMTVRQVTLRDVALPKGKEKVRSPLLDAYRQLLKNQAAVIGGIFVVAITLMAVFAGVLAPYHYAEVDFASTYAKPGQGYLAGTDALGRDILSRTIYGARISLTIGVVGATVSLIIGLMYGLASGFFGGWVDTLMMRVVDFMYGLPNIILVILMQVYFKAVSRRQAAGLAGALVELDNAMGGMFFIFVALGVFNWIGMARIARGQVLSMREKEFVYAARSVGSGYGRIIFRHILPNVLGPCIVAETMAIPGYIFFEAFLSFIGLGVNPPTPSWGAMINEGYQGLRSNPHLVIAPSIALTLTVLAFNFLGDGLRDAFDPSLRGIVGRRVFQRKGQEKGLARRVAVGLVSLVLVVGVTFVAFRGRGATGPVTPATEEVLPVVAEEAPAEYVTEYGHEISSPQIRYDTPGAAIVTSLAPIPSVYYTPAGKSMLGIIGRDTEVEVLGESTNEQGELYYLIKGFGMEGWMKAEDVTLEGS